MLLVPVEKFIVLLNGDKQVTLFPAQLAHEVLLTLVSLDSFIDADLFDFSYSIHIVLKASNHVLFGEVVFTIVLSLPRWSEWESIDVPGIILFGPASPEQDHGLAFAISELLQQLVKFVVQEHVLVVLDVVHQVLQHGRSRLLVEEVVFWCSGGDPE